jgi:hypothetical protein
MKNNHLITFNYSWTYTHARALVRARAHTRVCARDISFDEKEKIKINYFQIIICNVYICITILSNTKLK